MTYELTLGSPPKTGLLAPLGMLSYLRERILRGFKMKFSRAVFNTKALQNHLGLTKRSAELVDCLAKEINLSKNTINVQEMPDGSVSVMPRSDVFIAGVNGKEQYGIFCQKFIDELTQITLSIPYALVLKGVPEKSHVVYCITTFSTDRLNATIKSNGDIPMPGALLPSESKLPFDAATKGRVPVYIGKTSVGVANRLSQHISAAFVEGSMTRFHRVLRGNDKYFPQIPSISVIKICDSEKDAYNAEEQEIANIIGLDGIYVCNTIGSRQALNDLIAANPKLKNVVSAEYAEEMLAQKAAATAENWEDPQYAESVICNNPRNLDADEVRIIRFLGRLNTPVAEIAKKVGITKQRVAALLDSKTYRRIL